MISCTSPLPSYKTLILNTSCIYKDSMHSHAPPIKTHILVITLQIHTLCLATSLPTKSHVAAIFEISRLNQAPRPVKKPRSRLLSPEVLNLLLRL